MGYYIETGTTKGKAEFIIKNHDAIVIHQPINFVEDIPADMALICVIDNGPFEAAAFCYNKSEFQAFSDPFDNRPRTWLVMDRDKAKSLTRYDGK